MANSVREIDGTEFVFGILPYNGRKFPKYSESRYLLNFTGKFFKSMTEDLNIYSSKDLDEISKIILDNSGNIIESANKVVKILEYFPETVVDLNGNWEGGNSENLRYSNGGLVVYDNQEIRHRGLLKRLEATLFLEARTQKALLDFDMENSVREKDYKSLLDNLKSGRSD
ncbi:MAG TPA: hypothetical protein QGG70_02615 [Candidatus Pacearchaeota archaeon]|jgi:hypothetical protein|nr:hypothetical protein [Candidatus Pacearchaeota archaeon]